jgi:hypothetical protein
VGGVAVAVVVVVKKERQREERRIYNEHQTNHING